MRLTPADVHNVAFKKPSIGKRGYDEDEVDAFLDLVEAELSRLIEENNELSQRLAAGGFAAASTRADSQHQPAAQQLVDRAAANGQDNRDAPPASRTQVAEPVPAEPIPAQPTPVEPTAVEPTAAEPTAAEPTPVVEPAEPTPATAPEVGPAAHHVQAAKLLGLAQETAERLTGEAEAEAAATRSAANAESNQLLENAKAEAERLLSEAQGRSEGMVIEAASRAESLERDSRVRADAMDREAQSEYAQVMNQLIEQRTTLEKKIDDLRVFEREYRSRLKSWISGQLSQLDGSGAATSAGNSEHLAQQGAE